MLLAVRGDLSTLSLSSQPALRISHRAPILDAQRVSMVRERASSLGRGQERLGACWHWLSDGAAWTSLGK